MLARAIQGGVLTRFYLVLFTVAAALAIAPAALADSFTYTFAENVGGGDIITATGTLTGNLIGTGEYDITSGTITLTDPGHPNIDGTGILGTITAPTKKNTDYTFGISTSAGSADIDFGSDPVYPYLFPGANPQINSVNGALVFNITSGSGTGSGVALTADGPGEYQIQEIYYGNPKKGQAPDVYAYFGPEGTFDASPATSATPEPSSLLLLGTGLLGLAVVVFRKTNPTGAAQNS